ncbi:MAG: restriction endonuclease subunit S [Slackia sp.]|nr:restriction endonuclease subunit S [Slackia sp.]
MSRIDELIARLCPDGVEYRALGEVGEFLRGTSFQKKHFVEEGIPCVHYGQLYTHYKLCAYATKSFLGEEFAVAKGVAKPGDLIIATTSENEEDVCKAMAWLGETDVIVSNDAYIYRHALNPMYVAYFFQSEQFQVAKKPLITGTKVLRVSGASMSKIRIPVPPMEVQEEIVRVLDSFAELEAELEARRRQYAYYRDRLLSFENAERERETF